MVEGIGGGVVVKGCWLAWGVLLVACAPPEVPPAEGQGPPSVAGPLGAPSLPRHPAPDRPTPDEETASAVDSGGVPPTTSGPPAWTGLRWGDDRLAGAIAAYGLVAPSCSGDGVNVVPVAMVDVEGAPWLLTGLSSRAQPSRRFAALSWDGSDFQLEGFLSDAAGFAAVVDDPNRSTPWCRPASIAARSTPSVSVLLAFDPAPGSVAPSALVLRRVGASWEARQPTVGDLGGPLVGTEASGTRAIPHLFGPIPLGLERAPSWWWPRGLRNGAPDDVLAGYACPGDAGWGGCATHRLSALLALDGLTWSGDNFGEDLYAASWIPLGDGVELLAFIVSNGHRPGELAVPPLWRRAPGEARFSPVAAGDLAEVSQWQPMGVAWTTLQDRLVLAVTTNVDLLLVDPDGDRDPGFRSKVRLFDMGSLADAAAGVVGIPTTWERQGFASTPVLAGTGASWTPWAITAQLSPGGFCAAHVPDAGSQPGLVPEGIRCVASWTLASDGRPYLAPVNLAGLTPGLAPDRFTAFGLDVPVLGGPPDPAALAHDAQGLALVDVNADGLPDVLQEGVAGGLPVLRFGERGDGAEAVVRFDAPTEGLWPHAVVQQGLGLQDPWLFPQGWSQLGARGPNRDSAWVAVAPGATCVTVSLPDAGCDVTACEGSPATLACAAP